MFRGMGDIAEIIALLQGRGHRITLQRRAILDEILGTKGHITATGITRRVQTRFPRVNTSTVYRTLETLEAEGVLSHTHSERGAEYHLAGDGDHVHLTCSRCGAEEDLALREAESLKKLIVQRSGFRPDLTHFAISGLCARCSAT